MSQKWTPAQLSAITTTGVSLLVSAAAGSGKTSVLAERCAHLVCDAPQRCNVNQLLVVTFTEAAAGEMRARIEQALRRRLAGNSSDPHLQRQLALLDHANISTLHSFCARLLRQHFHKAGLDPAFRILDEDEARLLRLETARELFMDYYSGEETGQFRAFLDCMGEGQDQDLMQQVIRTYEILRSLVDPMGWMERAVGRVEEAAHKPLEESVLGREYLAIVRQQLSDLQRDIHAALESIRRMRVFPPYESHLEGMAGLAESWSMVLENGGYDALAKAVSTMAPLPRLPSVKEGTPGKDVAKGQIDALVKQFKEGPLVASLQFSTEQWQSALASTLPHLQIFLKLIDDFARRYRSEKQQARAVDFADLERHAFTLLNESRRHEQPRPSAIARQCHRLFQHVLVDEYQDINELQDAIVSLASRECLGDSATPNLFCVGDVKQSIYGFRLAEPRLFLERQSRIRSAASHLAQGIDLQSNFRSRAPLLNVLNGVFEKLMTAEAVDIEYDASHRLTAGAAFPAQQDGAFSGAPVELHLLPEDVNSEDPGQEDVDLERAGREALLVAGRIKDLMGHADNPRRRVWARRSDGQAVLREIEYRDIVILLRATRFHADQYAAVLRQHGIPVYNGGGGGYFEAMEVRDCLSLLRLLDNAQQDIPMAAVLRSPLSGLADPEESLARIRLAYPDRGIAFHEAVVRYAREKDDELSAKLRDFLADLREWRRMARQRPIAEILYLIFEKTGFLAFCSGLENGPQRVANLLRLHERAQQFGTFSRQGLYRFNQFLESLHEETDPAQASELSEAENAVRILSIHKSKGLEFPVVIVPALGKKINLQETSGKIVVDHHAHLGLQAIDLKRRIRYPSLASTLVNHRLLRNALAEEVRVLYVALTRAREHLILVGTCAASKPDQWARRFDRHQGPLPCNAILGARSMLDWLGPVAKAMESHDGGASIQVQEHPAEVVQEWISTMPSAVSRPRISDSLARLEPLPQAPAITPHAQEVIGRLSRAYAYAPFTLLPAAVAAGDLARQTAHAGDAPAPAMPRPRFLSPGGSPLERGTATHLFLEHLDFARTSMGELREQLQDLAARKLVSAAQAALVDLDAAGWFVATDLGEQLRRNAAAILRELPLAGVLSPERLGGPQSPDARDQLMLRGRVDVLLPGHDGYQLVDYKSDDCSAAQVEHRAELYRPQLELYATALERILPRPVRKLHLVFLGPRRIVSF